MHALLHTGWEPGLSGWTTVLLWTADPWLLTCRLCILCWTPCCWATRRASGVSSLIWDAFCRESPGWSHLATSVYLLLPREWDCRGTVWTGAKSNNYTAAKPFTMESYYRCRHLGKSKILASMNSRAFWRWGLEALRWLQVVVAFFLFFVFVFWLHSEACRILVPQPGIEPAPSAVRVQSPNHWTAREFPVASLRHWKAFEVKEESTGQAGEEGKAVINSLGFILRRES